MFGLFALILVLWVVIFGLWVVNFGALGCYFWALGCYFWSSGLLILVLWVVIFGLWVVNLGGYQPYRLRRYGWCRTADPLSFSNSFSLLKYPINFYPIYSITTPLVCPFPVVARCHRPGQPTSTWSWRLARSGTAQGLGVVVVSSSRSSV